MGFGPPKRMVSPANVPFCHGLTGSMAQALQKMLHIIIGASHFFLVRGFDFILIQPRTLVDPFLFADLSDKLPQCVYRPLYYLLRNIMLA